MKIERSNESNGVRNVSNGSVIRIGIFLAEKTLSVLILEL